MAVREYFYTKGEGGMNAIRDRVKTKEPGIAIRNPFTLFRETLFLDFHDIRKSILTAHHNFNFCYKVLSKSTLYIYIHFRGYLRYLRYLHFKGYLRCILCHKVALDVQLMNFLKKK